MRWENGHNSVLVYEKGSAYWITPSTSGIGVITLSSDCTQKLKELLQGTETRNEN